MPDSVSDNNSSLHVVESRSSVLLKVVGWDICFCIC